MTNLPKIEGEPYVYSAFPAYCTSPTGEKQVFEVEGDVPPGWQMPDGTFKGKPAPVAAPVVAPAPVADPVAGTTSEGEVDAAGTPWNADLHAATKGKTKAGLWRMKVGVARPEPAPLDL